MYMYPDEGGRDRERERGRERYREKDISFGTELEVGNPTQPYDTTGCRVEEDLFSINL